MGKSTSRARTIQKKKKTNNATVAQNSLYHGTIERLILIGQEIGQSF